MPAACKIKPSTKGNRKIGPVLTESRPTGPTCPESCPIRADCYSKRIDRYHPGVLKGMVERELARAANRYEWRIRRYREWSRETMDRRPIRFLVHGDLLDPTTKKLDKTWVSDVLYVAGTIRGFRGWGFTHCWRDLAPFLSDFQAAGIQWFASCHSPLECRRAEAAGYRVAFQTPVTIQEFNRADPPMRATWPIGLATPALVCPHQRGVKTTCLDCGYCWKQKAGHLVLLRH